MVGLGIETLFLAAKAGEKEDWGQMAASDAQIEVV